ncbi:unnamed protein product [Paramecium sonneborni]|uniref:Uncharacterized protein n=1 Tax=Paramecium sonneborni TaxID=65129 RepID=A0A8S1M6K3_9CILI|nr:unnamed protein product [Paramecium sonneborni]
MQLIAGVVQVIKFAVVQVEGNRKFPEQQYAYIPVYLVNFELELNILVEIIHYEFECSIKQTMRQIAEIAINKIIELPKIFENVNRKSKSSKIYKLFKFYKILLQNY